MHDIVRKIGRQGFGTGVVVLKVWNVEEALDDPVCHGRILGVQNSDVLVDARRISQLGESVFDAALMHRCKWNGPRER